MDEFESEINVSENAEKNFSDEGDTKHIDYINPDKPLFNPARMECLYVNFDAKSFQEKHMKKYTFT